VEGKAALNEEKNRQIRDFLREFKRIAAKNGIYVIPRDKNQQALAELGLTRKNRFDIIMTLSVADYCRGPEPDRNKAGCIWEFGRIVEGRSVYIKLKIAGTDGGDIALCISFHAAEFPLSFPCKGEEN
jgi:hypothetical protein